MIQAIVTHCSDRSCTGINQCPRDIFFFTIGLLTVAFALDHEKQEYYNLTIVAVDDGTPALSATQILTIIVLDVNDEPPVFTKDLYQASIYENKDPGELVIKIKATDKDSGNQLSPPKKDMAVMENMTPFLSPSSVTVRNS